jgi:serine/threonine protein kinase
MTADPPTSEHDHTPTPGSDVDPMVGKVLAGCRLVKRIGRGGLGAVYEALQQPIDRRVAVKVLAEDLLSDIEVVKQFKAEAALAAGLSHPNVARVFQAGEANGRLYFVMELVDGSPLQAIVKQRGFCSPELVALVGHDTGRGLAAAHRAGLIHRDIKPGNILIGRDGRARIVDFGLVSTQKDRPWIRTGTLRGTLGYMAPELFDRPRFDFRCDIYALGATLYYACTTQHPYKGTPPDEVVAAVRAGSLRPLRDINPSIPEPLAALIKECMSPDADKRPTSCDAIADRCAPFLA